MAVALQQQGKPKAAVEAYEKSLYPNPAFISTLENVSRLPNQLLGTELINGDFYKQLNRHNLDLLQRPKFQILQAIRALLFADTSMLRKHIANYNRCNEKLISELNQKEQKV